MELGNLHLPPTKEGTEVAVAAEIRPRPRETPAPPAASLARGSRRNWRPPVRDEDEEERREASDRGEQLAEIAATAIAADKAAAFFFRCASDFLLKMEHPGGRQTCRMRV